MLNGEQIAYIETLKSQYPDLRESDIIETLKNAGWSPEEIADAIKQYQSSQKNSSAQREDTKITHDVSSTQVTPSTTTTHESTAPIPTQTVPTSQNNEETRQENTQKEIIHIKEESTLIKLEREESHFSIKKALVLLLVILGLGGVSAGAYYLITNGFFKKTNHELTADNIFSYSIERLAGIETAQYHASLTISTNKRTTGALSYPNESVLSENERDKYLRDQDRFRDIAKIQDLLAESRMGDDFSYTKPYPTTLLNAGITQKDPLGTPYVYERSSDGSTYALIVTFETTDAVVALKGSTFSFSDDTDNRIQGTKVTFTENDYVSKFTFDGTEQGARIFGLFDLHEIESFIPQNFKAHIESRGTVDTSTEEPLNGIFGFGGDLTLGDASFALDAEVLKNNSDYYAIIHKIPAFFGTYSTLRDTWIHITEDDVNTYDYGNYIGDFLKTDTKEIGEQQEAFRKQLPTLIALLDSYKLLILTHEESVILPEGAHTKYSFSIASEKLLAFFEEAVTTFENEKYPIISDNETLRLYLSGAEAEETLTYIKNNVEVFLYLDQKGFPTRVDMELRYVPSASAQHLLDHQIDTTFSLVLSNINEEVQISIPERTQSLDEVVSRITGKSKTEILIERQETNIQNIRYALDMYAEWTGSYPATLTDLTKNRSELPEQGYTSNADIYGYEQFDGLPSLSTAEKTGVFLKKIPHDVFVKAPYSYTSRMNGSDYELGYTIQLPPFNVDVDPALYFTTDAYDGEFLYTDFDAEPILVPRFTEGKNIATKNVFSQALTETLNSDIDNASDGLEKRIGTDPKKSDTDGDSYSDSEELLDGSNPLGPGRLKGSMYRGELY